MGFHFAVHALRNRGGRSVALLDTTATRETAVNLNLYSTT
jgi:hypothetical protein